MEDYTGPGATNYKVVRDKILADSFHSIKKLNEKLNQFSLKSAENKTSIKDTKNKTEQALKTKEMLNSICKTFLN